MDQAFLAYTKFKGLRTETTVVDDAMRNHREECQLRLARIQNGKHPEYTNGHPKDAEKGR